MNSSAGKNLLFPVLCVVILASQNSFSEVRAVPETTPWQYFYVRCDSWHGPFASEEAATEEGAGTYYGSCGDHSIINNGTWGSGGVCGPGRSYPRWPWNFSFGVEVLNQKNVGVEYCQNPSNGNFLRDGFTVQRTRLATCDGNVGANQECILSLAPKKDLTQTCVTNPISIELGNKTETVIDYQGVLGLEIIRTYNSVLGDWRFSFETKVEKGAFNRVYVTRANGEEFVFDESNGGYSGYADSSVILRKIIVNDFLVGWELQELAATYTFNQAGKLSAYKNKGIELAYTYNDAGELENIRNSTGAELGLDWFHGEVIDISVPENIHYAYSYDANNNLDVRTVLKGGEEISSITYHYENISFPRALTGITDENNVRFATWGYDSQGRANSSHHNGGVENKTIDYSLLDDPVDSRVTVTNEFGKETTYHFEIFGGERKKVLVEGHQSQNCEAANKSYTYYPSGLLESKTDWQGNVTYFEYNIRGLESARTIASNTAAAQTIVTEWHPTFNLPSRIIEANKEIVYSYNNERRKLGERVSSESTFILSGSYNRVDGDGDGIADLWEQHFFGSMQYSGNQDFDSDGVSNVLEYETNLNPTDGNVDSDLDELPDAWEINYFVDLLQGRDGDFDGDGVSNFEELIADSDPTLNLNVNHFDPNRIVRGLALSEDLKTLSGANIANSQRLAYAAGPLVIGKKYYWEVSGTQTGVIAGIGSYDLLVQQGNYPGITSNSYGWFSNDGSLYNDGLPVTNLGREIENRLMIAFDPDGGKLWFGLNGLWQGDPGSNTGEHFSNLSGFFFPVVSIAGGAHASLHFQPNDWLYATPQDFESSSLPDDSQSTLARYWRIFILENNGGVFTTVAEIDFFDTSNNEIPLTSNSSIFTDSVVNGSNQPSAAIDDSAISKWTSAVEAPNYIGYDFGFPVALGSFMLMGHYSGGDQPAYAPRVFKVQYSNDNSVWIDHSTVFEEQTNWGPSEERIFLLD